MPQFPTRRGGRSAVGARREWLYSAWTSICLRSVEVEVSLAFNINTAFTL